MMVQNEDETDVFRALYPWICLYMGFDHSGVHAIQKKDALNQNEREVWRRPVAQSLERHDRGVPRTLPRCAQRRRRAV
jgi:hypothetical protein